MMTRRDARAVILRCVVGFSLCGSTLFTGVAVRGHGCGWGCTSRTTKTIHRCARVSPWQHEVETGHFSQLQAATRDSVAVGCVFVLLVPFLLFKLGSWGAMVVSGSALSFIGLLNLLLSDLAGAASDSWSTWVWDSVVIGGSYTLLAIATSTLVPLAACVLCTHVLITAFGSDIRGRCSASVRLAVGIGQDISARCVAGLAECTVPRNANAEPFTAYADRKLLLAERRGRGAVRRGHDNHCHAAPRAVRARH